MPQRPKEEEFKEKFPSLSKEMGGKGTIRVNSVRSSPREGERTAHTQYGYEPTVVDYLRRCATDAQALEIIDFLESKGEIDDDYAKRLRRQLAEQGLGSFGKRKEQGHYERVATG